MEKSGLFDIEKAELMDMLSADQFLCWAKSVRIVLDPIYSPPKCLVFEVASIESRWWNMPSDEAELHKFFSHLLTNVETWSTCYLWRRGGTWPNLNPPHNRLEDIRSGVGIGPTIPDGFSGAVRYPVNELGQLVGRITTHALSGWCVQDDLFVVPDHGQFIVQTDHHGVAHVSCAEPASMDRLIQRMATGGYALPDEPLDWTFKRPSWMA